MKGNVEVSTSIFVLSGLSETPTILFSGHGLLDCQERHEARFLSNECNEDSEFSKYFQSLSMTLKSSHPFSVALFSQEGPSRQSLSEPTLKVVLRCRLVRRGSDPGPLHHDACGHDY